MKILFASIPAAGHFNPLTGLAVLKDADENFPAWLDAIRSARHKIFFEHYIVADDEVGREFVAALAERARAGVRVYAIHDWFGDLGVALWEDGDMAGCWVKNTWLQRVSSTVLRAGLNKTGRVEKVIKNGRKAG